MAGQIVQPGRALLVQSVDGRLDTLSGQVNQRLDEGFRKTNETFASVMARLATHVRNARVARLAREAADRAADAALKAQGIANEIAATGLRPSGIQAAPLLDSGAIDRTAADED